MSRFEFDHTYTFKITLENYESFKKFGFSVRPNATMEHPGSQFCRFLIFENQRYLEFIEVKDEGKYFQEVVEKEDVPPYTPGFSFRAKQPMRDIFQECREEFKPFGI